METHYPYPTRLRLPCEHCGRVTRVSIVARTSREYLGLCIACQRLPENRGTWLNQQED